MSPDQTADTADQDPEKDIIGTAKARFERAKAHYGNQRILAEADTRFAMGDSDNGWQWPELIRNDRMQSQKVMLTVNTTAQHCLQVINEIRKNRPSGSVSPVDSGADKKTADILAGLIRNILTSSNADDAHDVAAEHSIYGGEGYWLIDTDYESETSFDQVIKVVTLPNPNRVFIDADARELDKSDAKWGFVFADKNKELAKKEYGLDGVEPSTWIDDRKGWFDDKTFVEAGYYWCEEKPDTACLYTNGQQEESCFKSDDKAIAKLKAAGFVPAPGPDGKPLERDTMRCQWYHCLIIGGHEKPIRKRKWAGKYLPIVSVVGKEVNVNGDVVRKGLVRDLKDPARIVNYAYSEVVQSLAMQNKIPYIAAQEAIESHEDQWQAANVSNAAYLPWNHKDSEGQTIPKPERQLPAVTPVAQIQLLELSLAQMRGASGQQNANFGIKSEAESGIGIQRLKSQGEIATFHFPDNLARGLKYEWKILIDLIPKYYTRRKIVRIIGLDGREEQATLDPELPGAYHEMKTQEDIERIFNPTVGLYDVAIDTGPSFQTQRQESSAHLVELAKADPTLMQKAGDLIVENMDFPASEQLSDRLRKFLPPGIADDDEGPDPVAQAQQQIQQMGQQLEEAMQEGLKLEKENQSLKAGEAAKMAAVQVDAQKDAEAAKLARDKALAELELKRQIADEEKAQARQKIDDEAENQRYKIDKETEVKLYAAQLNAQVTMETSGLNAQVALAGQETNADVTRQGQETNAEVARDGQKTMAKTHKEPDQDDKPKKRTMKVKGPSGNTYTVSIDGDTIDIQGARA